MRNYNVGSAPCMGIFNKNVFLRTLWRQQCKGCQKQEQNLTYIECQGVSPYDKVEKIVVCDSKESGLLRERKKV